MQSRVNYTTCTDQAKQLELHLSSGQRKREKWKEQKKESRQTVVASTPRDEIFNMESIYVNPPLGVKQFRVSAATPPQDGLVVWNFRCGARPLVMAIWYSQLKMHVRYMYRRVILRVKVTF